MVFLILAVVVMVGLMIVPFLSVVGE